MGHTPGPWVVAGDSIHDRETKYESDGARTGDTACRIATTEIMARQGEQEANARLIAAAPDMLKMLLELQECAEYWSEYDVPLGIVGRLNETIRKARGEE